MKRCSSADGNAAIGAAKEKCAAKVKLMTAKELAVSEPFGREFEGDTGSAWVAQLVERVLGKDEVTGSIPVPGSRICKLDEGGGSKDLQ
jgi:hypothetical protein